MSLAITCHGLTDERVDTLTLEEARVLLHQLVRKMALHRKHPKDFYDKNAARVCEQKRLAKLAKQPAPE